jgi:hypothetical protein
MEIEVLVPVAASAVEEGPLAQRLDGLEGRTIGFLNNQKANAGALLDHVADHLRRQARFGEVHQTKNATAGAPAGVMEHLRRCDAVVLAIAD